MTVLYVTGDLFEQEVSAIAHGVNCAGSMGSGIAVEFKNRWPAMYKEYFHHCARGALNPGEIFIWEERDLTIYNLGTQLSWRTKATITAIEKSVTAMLRHANLRKIDYIAMPRIGSGLGGLSWQDVQTCLEKCAESFCETSLVVVSLPETPWSLTNT